MRQALGQQYPCHEVAVDQHCLYTSDALKVFQAFPKGITALLLQYPYVQHGNRSLGAPLLA
jgi:hypothetical protein